MNFKTRGVHQGVPLQVANSHMGVRIKHKVDRELPGLQKKNQAAHSPQHHMVSGRQVPRTLNDPQMICYDR